MEKDFELSDNGDKGAEALEELSQEEINTHYKRLSDLKRGDGVITTFSKQQLSLMHKMLTAPEKEELNQVLLIADFLSDEEADDELAAYFEAKRLNMDTGWNIAHMISRCAVNRKGTKTNRVAELLEAMSHLKYTTNMPGKKYDDRSNSRSPLS